ncbi:hypothetical protein SCHPADRAFT_941133 [Schizopora paradoxa]|uniref:Uncharacterized protein n=1 Tax=Schizopora paradoxa TaxID=27342 RepID=A0A0H2RSY9_9AGAM|nr:hypothetical protein SCHPADRAFT_941133 [Schizopora paradoxa]
MTSLKEGSSGNGGSAARKNVIAEREQRKLTRDLQKEQEYANKQQAALNAAKAAAGSGSASSTDGQKNGDEQERRHMQEIREVQESFLSMQGGEGTPKTPPLQLKSSPPPLTERSASRQGNIGDSSGSKTTAPVPDLTPVMMVEDNAKDSSDSGSGPFSDSQQVPNPSPQQEDGTGEDVVMAPPESEQERKLNEAAVKAVLQADAEEQARMQAQSPTPTGSSASQAARKIEEAKAAAAQQSPRTQGLPNRPSPPSRQNSNATPGGASTGGGVSMAQQSSSSSGSSHGSSTTSTSWIPNPVAAFRGLSGAQRSGAGVLNANPSGGSQQDAAIYKEWQNALQENKSLREDKRKLTNSLSEQESHARSLENTVRANENQKRQQAMQINVLSRDLAEARRELDHHRRLVSQLREQYALVDADRLRFATQLSETTKLLESRTLELRTAETFLTKYDDTPGDEVVGIVNDINSQVLNIGGKVAEDITEAFVQNHAKNLERKVNVNVVNELLDVIGPKLVNILLKSDFTEDPTPVQLAIQSMLVNGICTILMWWPILPTNSFSQEFWTLYKSILKSEVQPVASRWRALGSKHYRQSGGADLHTFAVNGMLSHIAKILLVAGVYAPANEHDRRLDEFVRSCVGQSIDVMWHTADAFAQKIREHVHSTDYELMFVTPGEVFDPAQMRAQGAQPPPPKKGEKGRKENAEDNGWRVLCTTDLGLRRITNRGKPGDNNPQLATEVMNKTVVIFEHELEGM